MHEAAIPSHFAFFSSGPGWSLLYKGPPRAQHSNDGAEEGTSRILEPAIPTPRFLIHSSAAFRTQRARTQVAIT